MISMGGCQALDRNLMFYKRFKISSNTNLDPKYASIRDTNPPIVQRTIFLPRHPLDHLPQSKIPKINQARIESTALWVRCWVKIS